MNSDPLGLVNRDLGEYRVSEFRSNGAFGFVYRAYHIPTHLPVALKVLNPNAGSQPRREFDNEGSLLSRLTKSRHVVNIIDTGKHTVTVSPGHTNFALNLDYHVLELADGSLSELLTDLPSLDWMSRLALLRDAVLGVHQMHHNQIAHRDLKAANCLLFLNGYEVRAKLGDLGRARDLSVPASVPPTEYLWGRGDPDFAPPEFVLGAGADTANGHRCADLYGVGSLFYELTLGQGITATATFPQALAAPLNASHTTRVAEYNARLAEVRSWYQPAFSAFDGSVPKPLRDQAGRLIRQLCDPDPIRRLPLVAVGKRSLRPRDLCWLINRIDIMRIILKNSLITHPGAQR